MKIRVTSVLLALAAVGGAAAAQPVLMSPEWAQAACEAWNRDAVLTDKLVESGWVKNDKGRGYKVMQVFRTDCGASPTAEMRIALKDGKALARDGPRRVRADAGDDVRPARVQRPEDGGDGQHGTVRELPAAGRQGAGRHAGLPGDVNVASAAPSGVLTGIGRSRQRRVVSSHRLLNCSGTRLTSPSSRSPRTSATQRWTKPLAR